MFDIGNQVIDKYGNIGKVVNVKDLHNIEVEYYSGGSGIYCIDPECNHYDPITPHESNETKTR